MRTAAAAVSLASSAAVWEFGLVYRCQLHGADVAEPSQPLCCSELVCVVAHYLKNATNEKLSVHVCASVSFVRICTR